MRLLERLLVTNLFTILQDYLDLKKYPLDFNPRPSNKQGEIAQEFTV